MDDLPHISEFQRNDPETRGIARMAAELVEYLATTRLGERGTLTLPKPYRDALKLKTGSRMTILRIGDGLILIPEQKRFERLCDSIATRLENGGITEGELQATLPEIRIQLMRSHYPELSGAEVSRPNRSKRPSKGRHKK